MTIEAKTWRRFTTTVSVVSVPLVIILFWEPDVGSFSRFLPGIALAILVAFGCIGALAGVLARVGSVQFHYTEVDKRHLHYRLSRLLAEMRQTGAPDEETDEKS